MKSFMDRRFENPDFDITARIYGCKLGSTGKILLTIAIDGESDLYIAAQILDKAAQVLRIEDDNLPESDE